MQTTHTTWYSSKLVNMKINIHSNHLLTSVNQKQSKEMFDITVCNLNDGLRLWVTSKLRIMHNHNSFIHYQFNIQSSFQLINSFKTLFPEMILWT